MNREFGRGRESRPEWGEDGQTSRAYFAGLASSGLLVASATKSR
jgi:hypothetical protein